MAGRNDILRWRRLGDAELLAESRVEAFRGSGPGGQKRNKTSSAVRIVHLQSGCSATSSESRSQAANKSSALFRLKLAIATDLALRVSWDEPPGEWFAARIVRGRLDVGKRDEIFPATVGVVFDALVESQGRVAEAAAMLGLTTAGIVAFLELDLELIESANRVRKLAGHPMLKSRG